MQAVGHVIASTLTLKATIFRFLDANGQPVVDSGNESDKSQATLFTTVKSVFNKDVVGKFFDCFAVDGGDITSYTREAIDARMKALKLHDGDHYVAEVIEPNAAQVGDKPDDIYLAYSWDNSKETNTSNFSAIQESFKEDSWSLESEVYAGVSGGGGVSAFGLGEELSFSFMVGGSFSHEETNATESKKELSIGIEDGIELPPAGLDGTPKGVVEFGFRLYFLPPPRKGNLANLPSSYWARELQASLAKLPKGKDWIDPITIDENSSPWRVFYMVSHYTLKDGTKYPPS